MKRTTKKEEEKSDPMTHSHDERQRLLHDNDGEEINMAMAAVVNENVEGDETKFQQHQQQQDTLPHRHHHHRRRALLLILILSYMVSSIASTVGRKLCLDAFGEHLVFFRQILGNFLYDLWATGVVLMKWKFVYAPGAERAAAIPSPLSKASPYPLYYFAALGFIDGSADFLTSVGGVHSPGSLQTLLSQLVIPFTVVLAYFITRAKFQHSQLAGAAVILAGVCVATIPLFDKSREAKNSHHHHHHHHRNSAEGEKTYWYSVLIFAIGQIPSAASVVCKDYLFKKGKIDVFFLSCLVSWCQLFITWVFVPLQSFHSMGGIPLDQIGDVVSDGFRCFIGERVPKNRDAYNAAMAALHGNNATVGAAFGNEYLLLLNSNSTNATTPSALELCRGAYVPTITLIYSLAGFAQGILQLYIVKMHSATLAILCQAVTLPLSNLAYSVPAFVGGASKAEKFSVWDIVGLIVTVAGLLLYQSKAIRQRWCSSEEESASSSSDSEGGNLEDKPLGEEEE